MPRSECKSPTMRTRGEKTSQRMRLWVVRLYSLIYRSTSNTALGPNVKSSIKRKKNERNKDWSETVSSVWLLSCRWRKKIKKKWWSWMPFGRKHVKIAQLCEDKGKACTGSQPSSSIWVSSSLSPGGTWKYGSYGGPEWIYCHLLAPPVWTILRRRRAWLLVIYTPWFTTDERPVQSKFQVPLMIPLHWTTLLTSLYICAQKL